MAAATGCEAAILLLLENGADKDSKDYDGRTPLSWAAANGHKAVVQLLLGMGADIEAKDHHGQTPLSWAAFKGQDTMVQLLQSAMHLNTTADPPPTPRDV